MRCVCGGIFYQHLLRSIRSLRLHAEFTGGPRFETVETIIIYCLERYYITLFCEHAGQLKPRDLHHLVYHST